MRSIWLIVSTISLANLLALGGFLGWLGTTGRLSPERAQKVKEMFARPVSVELADLQAQAVAHDQERTEAEQTEKLAEPPVPAAERLARDQAESELAMQRMLRRQREIDDLGSQLLRRQDELDRREKDLEDRIAAFEDQKRKYLEIEGAAQFKSALATLEGLKAKEAKATLEVMLAQSLTDEVIAYLSRMDERKRAAIISEFVKSEPAVAADLLERLRTRGVSTTKVAAVPAEEPRTDGAGSSSAP